MGDASDLLELAQRKDRACAKKYTDPLEERIHQLEDSIRFLLSFAPTDCPSGLDPTFYHTLSYEGDKALQDRIDNIKSLLTQRGDV